MYHPWLSSNLWKYFVILFTNRRNFIPILSVYYLTLPNTYANEVWIYTGIGYVTAMIFQIPSWYIADRWWQKNTIILAKIFLIFSSVLFLFGDNLYAFILWALCMSLGANSFSGGTLSSFLKWTLERLDRGNEFRHVSSKIAWNVSLLSVIFIVWLPFLTTIDIRLPLFVGLILDIVWFIIATQLVGVHTPIEKHEQKPFFVLLWEVFKTQFFWYALFAGVITWFLTADSAFRPLYLTELWYPLTYIGLVMGGSRIVWWMVWSSIHTIEKYVSSLTLVRIELFLFPLYYIVASYITNPWILGILISCIVGWLWGRNEIYTDMLIENIPDPKYRATLLSVKLQIENIIQVVVIFAISGIMGISYSLGFWVLGVVLLLLLISVYIYYGSCLEDFRNI